MAEVQSVLDPPVPSHQQGGDSRESPTIPPLIAGLLRRWPWLLLGLMIGQVFGVMYHLQRPPVYQSTAQLMVLKNRPELAAGGAGDVRVQFVEDYIAGQVILLRSERILRRAAERHLLQQGPFEHSLPPTVEGRMQILMNGFTVSREKEPGSNVGSNVLGLQFKAGHAADAPRYLRAIIDAYREELAEVFEDASARQLRQVEEEIAAVEKTIRDIASRRAEAERSLLIEDPVTGRLRVPEDLTVLRTRIATNRTTETSLRLRQQELDSELEELQKAQTVPALRQALLQRLGGTGDRSVATSVLTPDVRQPEALLRHLRFRRSELMARYGYGEGHPEVVALDRQIREVERELQERGPEAGELQAYRYRLLQERTALLKKIEILTQEIARDEKKLLDLTPIYNSIQKATEELQREETRLRDLNLLRDQIRRTERGGVFEVKEVTTPTPAVQVAPVWLQSIALGLMLGVLLGGGSALALEWADRSFRSPADIRRQLGVPVLGHIPYLRLDEEAEQELAHPVDASLVVLWRPHSAEAEAIRALRNQVLFSTSGRDHLIVQITSPHPGDGKSTLAANLAISLALAGKRVALLDCDWRKPRLHRLFALPTPAVGLASVVASVADINAAAQATSVDNLTLYPCGPRPESPAELLTSKRYYDVLQQLRPHYDFLIVDSPPVLAVSDAAAVAARVDEVVLVFRMRRDAKTAVERTLHDLQAVGGHILGVAVNALPMRDLSYRYYYAGYRYSDAYHDAG